MRKFAIILSAACCFMAMPVMSELTHTLIINEVMQSVTRGSMDQLNEYPDGWVELYNPSNTAVTLTGYAIGEKNNFNKCFPIPKATKRKEEYQWWTGTTVVSWEPSGNISVPAKGYLVIYCDNEMTTCGSEVHTDFRMPNAKGGTLYLFDSGKHLVDSMYLPPMPATDVAYGREADGSNKMGYMLSPTKGSKNSGGIAKMVLPYPNMTESRVSESKSDSGEKMSVSISLPAGVPDDAVIRYTTDGTEPTSSSAVYSQTLQIGKTTIVRASIFAKDCVTPPAATRSYIFLGRKLTVPIVSMVTDKKNLNDSKIGIIVNNTSSDNKENWRRPVIMDYFPGGATTSLFNQGAEIRVSGAYSRSNRQKSFIVYADSRFSFGSKDYFEAPFWQYTGSDMTQSPSIGLRSSGNDFNFSQMRDGVSQMLFGLNTDLDWQDFQPAITFINGEYYGILNIRERANEDNIWMHYNTDRGGHLTEITLIENPTWWGSAPKVGDMGQYNQFTSFLNNSSKNDKLSEYESRMDVVEFTNFMMANIYMSNTDFPGNNFVMWRPEANGGKWRFILKDVDRSLGFCYWHGESDNKDGGRSDAKYLRWILQAPKDVFKNNYDANGDAGTQIIRQLMAIHEYREMFVDRFTVYLGDFLTADNITSVIDKTANLMSVEMEYHKEKYGGTMKEWQTELSNMKTWANERTENMYTQLRELFTDSKYKYYDAKLGLGVPVVTTINKEIADCGNYNVTINGIPLTRAVFDGKLYAGRKYSISAVTKDGSSDDIGWRVVCKDKKGAVLSNDVYDKPLCEVTPGSSVGSIEISLIGNVSAIDENCYSMEPVDMRYYNMQGIESSSPFDGMNIIRYTYPDGSVSTQKLLIK